MIPAMSSTVPLAEVAATARDGAFPRAAEGMALLLDHGERHGLPPSALLVGTGLARVWGDRDLRPLEVTAAQELRVARTLRSRLPGDPSAIGAAVGARYRAATFGAFGYAMATCRTAQELLELALRYFDLSHAFTVPSAALEGDVVRLAIDGRGVPHDVRALLVARDATAIAGVLRELVPRVDARLEVRPDDAVLTFPAAQLALPLRGAGGAVDPATAASLCDELAGRRRGAGPTERAVRVVCAQLLAEGAPAASVAAALGWSERTLRRRLAAEGTAYQRVLDAVRSGLAASLLAPPASLPVAEVARRLGYADATTLIRAHRRWTGRTPRATT